MSSTRKIILKSSDKESFKVEEAVALESQTTKHMIGHEYSDDGIPLPNATSKIFSKVIEYRKKHINADRASSIADDNLKAGDIECVDLKAWVVKCVKVDQATLFDEHM